MRSLESSILEKAEDALAQIVSSHFPGEDVTDSRLYILERVASRYAGWSIENYLENSALHVNPSHTHIDSALLDGLLDVIVRSTIPIPLALSALSREILPQSQQRTTGAYYTDWRLAQMLAKQAVGAVTTPGLWVDPACGTGILLVAAAMEAPPGADRDNIIAHQLTGADLSDRALRGTLLSVASLTSDVAAIRGFSQRLLKQDSLRSKLSWTRLAPNGVALTIANPPWERLRVSRHETLKQNGVDRHYGQKIDAALDLSATRRQMVNYVDAVAAGTRLQGTGDHDLYKLFMELSIGLACEDGVVAMLVPAGLIRAKGTATLREELDAVTSELSISVFENRARNFAIDTRFKFLAVVARVGIADKAPISLRVADRTGILPTRAVSIGREDLVSLRPDRSVPEVRSSEEWDLFARLTRDSRTVGDPAGPWHPIYRREVDMTTDSHQFRSRHSKDTVPVLEGRHVTQFRWRAKTYVAGQGRAAIWHAEPLHSARIRTQWHIPRSALRPSVSDRITRSRVSFCDITGQTNERSLLVARVPENFVCGNKVPTLTFEAGNREREDLFIGLANSFVVDWMLRRVVTTSVNYFLLDSLPLPRIDESSRLAEEIISLTRQITLAEGEADTNLLAVGLWRGRLDALVALSWGLTLVELELVVRDFPLLDRGQPTLPGEGFSTVTRDCVLSNAAALSGSTHPSQRRFDLAVELGASPYVGAEYV